MKSETLNIEGMSCGHCVASVTQALKETDGVEVEHVEIGKATVSYDPIKASRDQLVSAVEEMGFSIIEN